MQNHIAEFRKAAGLSQQELADAIAVSRKTISTVETSRFTPSVIIALKIARQFETTVEQLFSLEEAD
ncbi:MAG: putative transcriptional regulator [Pseudoalteromonas rhizosphaerae]|uniref:Helix-turn-helix transcriptional regulator n=1 Tax=Pseudoalteromonas neustonica TaxID=1840331 RepID=A0ABY3F8J4_9GAMM|nr:MULTISPECIES: helix-turn-helix transcriptional regulator [Pseudoalteromonas]MBB1294113.1 helix-turn-helix transcriptional regulator [Pseudoalteromonas sp. SR41-4]MBB1303259.1 helix-turn-helix transcriptional regulator [Pseudoalteromonas sp. SR44-8]MBB1311484.1 helix-turn-helix transcriptional regulator [Pseudoalteromonas sp. SR41-8]MBB1399610.1 helix-turn-helix transcriptional regulator [Pseudoalteromonas sp. SG44-8]MBB1411049.1 helix-turn-helix transcriptional regulator [Pseudoalteromonas 